jgi:hypothetical protein
VKALGGPPALKVATVAVAVKNVAETYALQAQVEALKAKKVMESPKVTENVAPADPSRAKEETSDIDGEMAEGQGAGRASLFSLASVGGLVGAAIGGLVGAAIGGLVGGAIGGLVGGFGGAGIGGIISEGR